MNGNAKSKCTDALRGDSIAPISLGDMMLVNESATLYELKIIMNSDTHSSLNSLLSQDPPIPAPKRSPSPSFTHLAIVP